MRFREKYNKMLTGVLAGVILPLIGFVAFWLITRDGDSMKTYFGRIGEAGNITEIMSVSVFTNIVVFLFFNRLDMLRASKGVLGVTILWALAIFGIKLF